MFKPVVSSLPPVEFSQGTKQFKADSSRGKSVLILIAGKQKSLRSALQIFLQSRPGYEVAGTVADKETLFKEVESKSPDLLLLDEDFTDSLVEKVIEPLLQIDPCPQIILLISRVGAKKVYLDAGVAALVQKTDPPKSLLTAIETVRLRRNSV